jgi:hypothetical protein
MGRVGRKWGDDEERRDDGRGRNKTREEGVMRGEIRRGRKRGTETEDEEEGAGWDGG